MSDEVKVLDAGDKLLLSSASQEPLEKTLAGYVARGSQVVSNVALVGRSWVAACTPPTKAHAIEEVGFKRLISGPTREAVQPKANAFIEIGAGLLSDVEEMDGVWMAVCDMGGRRPTARAARHPTGPGNHSGSIPAALTMFAHLVVSLRM